jgi:hypothetical protein
MSERAVKEPNMGTAHYSETLYSSLCLSVFIFNISTYLTFKRPGWYLNFNARFMRNILFEQKKIKYHKINGTLWKRKQIMQHVLKML